MACYNSADLCAVRLSVINDDGMPLYSETDGSAYSMTPISLQVTPTVEAGETVTTRTGCGDICYTRTDPDVDTGADLVLTLCTFDPELIALATGAEPIDSGGATIGWAKGVVVADPTESHFWTKTLDGSSPVAAPNDYWHHVFPKVTWNLGSYTLGRDSLQMVLNGTATSNGNLGSGGFSDVPTITDPYYVAAFTASDIPDPSVAPYNSNGFACGYVDTPAS